MEKKLKITKKVKYSLIANGSKCGYSLASSCSDPLCYAAKSPVPLKGEGLYIANDKN